MSAICTARGYRRRPGRALAAVICAALSLPAVLRAERSAELPLRGVALVAGRPANVVVWLEAAGGAKPAPARKVVLDQRNLRFEAQVLVVRVGYETIPSRQLHARRATIGGRIRVRDAPSERIHHPPRAGRQGGARDRAHVSHAHSPCC